MVVYVTRCLTFSFTRGYITFCAEGGNMEHFNYFVFSYLMPCECLCTGLNKDSINQLSHSCHRFSTITLIFIKKMFYYR